jgi:hypothetical protein
MGLQRKKTTRISSLERSKCVHPWQKLTGELGLQKIHASADGVRRFLEIRREIMFPAVFNSLLFPFPRSAIKFSPLLIDFGKL